jgi:uncharacterized protein
VLEFIGLAFIGFFVGAYGTVIGAGGGFILVPVLLILYPDYKPEQLTAISLAVVFANATSGSIAYARQRRVDYVTGLLFAATSAPGVIAGALVVHLLPQRVFSALFGVLLLAIAVVAVRSSRTETIRAPVRGKGVLVRHLVDPEGRTYIYGYKIWQGVAISVGVGFVSSLFGIGGGVIHVPAMIVILHIPVAYAVATSHFVLAFMSGGATIVHLIDGSLSGDQLLRAVALAVGAIPGAQVGAHIAHRFKARQVLMLLAVAIAFLSARVLLKAIFDL